MGAWIEILLEGGKLQQSIGRTPRWVRGLKYKRKIDYVVEKMSHPTMGAWIEISVRRVMSKEEEGRTPRWVRGLK